MNLSTRIRKALGRQLTLPARLDSIQEALGRIESRLQTGLVARDPREYEFKVYSQWGEDGIIDHLASSVWIANKSFVEFGVEKYTEANTLFLLKHRNWRGLIIDGSPSNIEAVKKGDVFWRYDLHAEAEFITRDNINELILRNGFSGDIGLLSVDIDGNDYWIWEEVSCVSPRIIISEYNSLFGPTATISIPYNPDFYRTDVNNLNTYYGASICALNHLAQRRGYTLVAGNSAGNNVFFVRNDCLGQLQPQLPEQAYVRAAFRESRSGAGLVTGLNFVERQMAIGHMPVVDVVTGKQLTLSEAL